MVVLIALLVLAALVLVVLARRVGIAPDANGKVPAPPVAKEFIA